MNNDYLEAVRSKSHRQIVDDVQQEYLQERPFNPRQEVSKDARYIVKHLYIILIAIPLLIGFTAVHLTLKPFHTKFCRSSII